MPKQSPVKLVLFDVFDTLCTPRLPIHLQYTEEAHKAGISSVTPESIKAAFKPAFTHINKSQPLYGKNLGQSPEQWWTALIRQVMQEAGASTHELDRHMPVLAPALLDRFESDIGYRNFPETLDCLQKLKDLGISTSVVSNADPRILKTLSALSITSQLTYPPILSWDVEHSKPSPEIFQHACRACGVSPEEGVIMVGDELKADYFGSVSAGLDGRLIRRQGEWSDGASRGKEEDLSGVKTISSLLDIVKECESRQV